MVDLFMRANVALPATFCCNVAIHATNVAFMLQAIQWFNLSTIQNIIPLDHSKVRPLDH
jgi:hypothetical protein